MSKQSVMIFLCTGKDCRKAWRRACDISPSKWLRRQVQEAGLPYKLHIVETECMDRCDQAANLCCVHGDCAALVHNAHSPDEADRLLAALRSCVEASVSEQPSAERPG